MKNLLLLISVTSFLYGETISLVYKPIRKYDQCKIRLTDKYIDQIKKLPEGSEIHDPELTLAIYEALRKKDLKALYSVTSRYAEITPGLLFNPGTETIFDFSFIKNDDTIKVELNKKPIVFNTQLPIYENQNQIKSFRLEQLDLKYVVTAQIKVQTNGKYMDFGDKNNNLTVKIRIYNEEIKAKYSDIKEKIDRKINSLLESERTLIVDPIMEVGYLICFNRFISELLDLIRKDQLQKLDSLLDLYLTPLIKLTDIQSFEICIEG